MKFSKYFEQQIALEEINKETSDDVTPIEQDLEELNELHDQSNTVTQEIGKGFEAIVDLATIAQRLETAPTDAVSMEAYNDMASIAFQNIIKTIGFESENQLMQVEEVLDADNSPDKKYISDWKDKDLKEKIKDFINKLIEAIKRMWEHIKSFSKEMFRKLTSLAERTKRNMEKAKAKIVEKSSLPKIIIENPRFFVKEYTVGVDEVFNGRFSKAFGKNIDCLFEGYEELGKLVYIEHALSSIMDKLAHKLSSNNKLHKEYGFHVTSEGYIDIEHRESVEQEDSHKYKISFQTHVDDNKSVEKQILVLVSSSATALDVAIWSVNKTATYADNMQTSLEKKIEEKIQTEMRRIKNIMSFNSGMEEKTKDYYINSAKELKRLIGLLNGFKLTIANYIKEFLLMLSYYSTAINEKATATQE